MASAERDGSNGAIDLMDRLREDRPDGRDPAADAARVIGDEALSILLAVEARAAEIDAAARRHGDEIRRAAEAATAPALARLRSLARALEAPAAELDDLARERAGKRGHGS